jgi:hypothetical protein
MPLRFAGVLMNADYVGLRKIIHFVVYFPVVHAHGAR